MKSVSILISTRNSFEAIQLCIESVRHYTRYPNYKIVVFDDYSYYPDPNGKGRIPNEIDHDYLRKCQKKGWIELHENHGPRPLTHGGSLNKLVNEYCDTELAAILDCDIQIKDYDWLWDMVRPVERDPKILAVVDWRAGGFARWCYRTAIYLFWFGLLNMETYRDGMEVDWKLCKTDRRDWPYYLEFKDGYPPENSKWTHYFNTVAFIQKERFDANVVSNDPGAKLYIQAKYHNPKDYKVIPLPPGTRAKYHHYGHLSMLSMLGDND